MKKKQKSWSELTLDEYTGLVATEYIIAEGCEMPSEKPEVNQWIVTSHAAGRLPPLTAHVVRYVAAGHAIEDAIAMLKREGVKIE